MSKIKERISRFRQFMHQKGINAFIIPNGDAHQSEYVAPRWKGKDWISGFTGSAGTIVITQDHAGLWTDSRYFIQAETELDADIFTLHKIYDRVSPTHFQWLMTTLQPNSTIGFDGFCFSYSQVRSFEKMAKEHNIHLVKSEDLLDYAWKDRPMPPSEQLFLFDEKFAGISRTAKLHALQEDLAKENIDHYILSSLDDIAWLLNIRSSDIEFNPVCMSYILYSNQSFTFFIHKDKISVDDQNTFRQEGIDVLPYDELLDEIAKIKSGKFGFDPSTTSSLVVESIQSKTVEVQDFTSLKKAIKNETEIRHFRQAMIKDGVALLKSFRWLESSLSTNNTITEFDLANNIAENRATQDLYFGESFPAIVGYKGNGAIVHYRPMKNTSTIIENNGFLLVDCGAQYFDGTTDITRTFCLSEPTSEQKTAYTAVLKGHIQLATAIFPEGTNGGQLDTLARHSLWSKGLNYLHGTGHGVGFFLNVHEKPQGIAPYRSSRINVPFQSGMVTSNEPGYYKENEYGIRIENLILTRESEFEGFLENETITLFPIETKMIHFEELRRDEVDWLNGYHKKVFEVLSPRLDADERKWLEEKCKAV